MVVGREELEFDVALTTEVAHAVGDLVIYPFVSKFHIIFS
jgi:hypothetical protein